MNLIWFCFVLPKKRMNRALSHWTPKELENAVDESLKDLKSVLLVGLESVKVGDSGISRADEVCELCGARGNAVDQLGLGERSCFSGAIQRWGIGHRLNVEVDLLDLIFVFDRVRTERMFDRVREEVFCSLFPQHSLVVKLDRQRGPRKIPEQAALAGNDVVIRVDIQIGCCPLNSIRIGHIECVVVPGNEISRVIDHGALLVREAADLQHCRGVGGARNVGIGQFDLPTEIRADRLGIQCLDRAEAEKKREETSSSVHPTSSDRPSVFILQQNDVIQENQTANLVNNLTCFF